MSEVRPDAAIVWPGTMPTTPTSTSGTPGTTTGTALTPNGPPAAPTISTVPVDANFFGQGYQPPPLPADAPLEQRLYRTTAGLVPSLRQYEPTMRDELGWPQARVEAFSRGLAEAFQDAGLPADVFAPLVVSASLQGHLAQRLGTPVDTARLLAEETELRREMRTTFGPERAERILEAVATFLSDNEKLYKIMQQPGFSSAPSAGEFMRKLVEHVRVSEFL